MKDEFSQRLNSFVTSLAFASKDEWKPVWQGQTPMMFTTKLAEAETMVGELQAWVQKQATTSVGATEAKKEEHDQLEAAAFIMAQALVTYFMDQDDLVSAEPFRRARSYWQTLKDQDLLAQAQAVIDAATPLTTGPGATAVASNYGISAAAVTALTGARADFADIVGLPTATRASRKAYTTLMRAQFLPVTLKFRDLDRLVLQFEARPSGPEFVAGWTAARNVVGDTGGGSGGGSGGGGGDTPPTVVPTAPQNVTVTAGAAGSGAATVDSDPPAAGEAVTSFRVFNNGTLVVEVPSLPTELTGFGPGESLYITVSAVNVIGEGPQSGTVSGQAG